MDVLRDPEKIISYMEDRENVFGDPDRFGLAVILAFYHGSYVTVGYAFSKQQDLGMNLPRKKIKGIFEEWVSKGYAEHANSSAYKAAPKLIAALEKDGVTEKRLSRLADALLTQR